MSVERQIAFVACGLSLCAVASAAEEPAPDVDFLEYLGTWEETDEEWLMYSELRVLEMDTQSDPAPEGEESTEQEDES